MKKLLALVLALVMSMSLVTISNAAFKDADKISNKEAVDVMAAVGVLAGYDNGEFGATDTLTRAQACKIIAYLDLGGKTADAIKGSGAVFTDVAATAWYAGYVEYCAGAGYVAGIGDNKFAPDEKVTGVQFAKMLLCALGYKAEVEGYTGADYTIAIARDANKNDLFKALSIVTSAALTREQAAQMAFNALKATVVEYQGGTNVSTSDGTKVTVNATRKEVSYDTAKDYAGRATNGTQQLCEKLYGTDLKLNSSTEDGMGRPAHAWTYKAEDVTTATDSADHTAFVTSKYNNVTKVLENINKKFVTNTATVYVNGAAGTLASGSIGDKVEVYVNSDNAKKVETIVVTHYTVAKLSGDPDTKVSDDDTLVKVPGVINAYNSKYTTKTVSGYADLKKDDIVFSYEDSDNNVVIAKADSFSGVLTAVSGTEFTIGGTKYKVSGATGTMNSSDMDNYYKEAATWYTDAAGNLIYVKGEESTIVGYVLAYVNDSDVWGKANHKVKLLTMDGTVATVTADAAATSVIGHFVKYSVKDNEYTLTDTAAYVSGTTEGQKAAVNGATITVRKGNPTIKLATSGADFLTNANTTFLVRDYKNDGTAKDTFTAYAGYSKVPSMSLTAGANVSAVVYAGTNGYAKYVVIDPNSNISGTTTASDLFYVVDAAVSTLYDKDGVSGYSVKAIKNGGDDIVDLTFSFNPSTAVTANGNAAIAVNKAYVATQYNDDGQITAYGTALTTGDEYIVGSATGKTNNGVFKLGTDAYVYTDATVVYFIDKDDELTVTTVADIDDDINNSFVAVRASKTTTDDDYSTIKTVFIREVIVDVDDITVSSGLTDMTSTAGSTLSLSVTASAGSATLSYEWYVNGVKQAETSSSFSYSPAVAGEYAIKCVITATGDASVDGLLTKTATQTCTVTVS